jgi:capsid protein
MLPAGYTVKVGEAADLGNDFEPFVRVSMQHIARRRPDPASVEDYRGMNDGIYRAITLEFRRTITFTPKQIFIERFCQPIWEWWISWGLVEGV